jgi:DNA-binding response OmpR family regulator
VAVIVIVEDNESIREAVAGYLALEDHEVIELDGVSQLIETVRRRKPDLLVLDVMLPDGSGFAAAKRVRAESSVPLLFLTARDAESDRVTGFELGADDYVVKPFSPKELVLRIGALLRRSAARDPAARGCWSHGGARLCLDVTGHRADRDGVPLELTAAEWEILSRLAAAPGTVVSREQLLGESLGYMAEGSERTIDTHVKNLRAKLGDPGWIETVRGYGYRFAGETSHG